MTEPTGLRASFDAEYAFVNAPWELDGPAAVVVRLAEEGLIVGSVLDVGCGLGANARYLASLGHPTLGIDFSSVAIRRARDLAAGQGLPVDFRVHDALDLGALGRRFDTGLDIGLLDCLTTAEVQRYVAGLAAVIRPGGRVLITTWAVRSPRALRLRVRPRDLRRAFGFGGWRVESITPEWMTGPGGDRAPAWLAQIARVATTPPGEEGVLT